VASPRTEERKNYVLIIDEINRGNVAGIFGELITLIEENKRKGKPEALEVTLPYSQEPFSIPDNLYIIGTMNTADRSVEALDAALRRRFSFVPMMPNTKGLELLQNSTVDLHALLTKMNERLVQLLDEDHQIGHSHFWELHKEADPLPALRRVFADKIIPQLEEYFHRDRSKLRLVLGPAFVDRTDGDNDLFLGDGDDQEVEPRPIYTITKQEKWTEEAFRSIHG
jgi:5-methylcytosine-specific restriction protein B